ncbi:MAG TPA: hypothetical protein VI076_01835 [Actinopolymorphaceae bacterium]
MTWKRVLPFVAAGWTGAYAVVHVSWALHEPPVFDDSFGESLVPGRWTPVALSVVAAVSALTIALRARRGIGVARPAPANLLPVVGGWAAGAGMVLYSFLFALGIAGAIFDGLFGGSVDWYALVVRGSGAAGGALTLLTAMVEQRRVRHACERCGRVHGRTPEDRTVPSPWWAYVGAYVAVLGCLARFGAQAVVGVEKLSVEGRQMVSFVIFAVAMFLAGTVLPLALAHRWGRIWPWWVGPLAGRNVPRWIVLVPALFIGAGLTGYFGVGSIAASLQGRVHIDYPLWWIVAVFGGYVLWGVGLLVASASYLILTKPECPSRARPLAFSA